MRSSNIIKISILVGGVFFISCGGSGSESKSGEGQQSKEAESPVFDPNAKSDSKGVGRFTSVEVGEPDAKMAEKGEALFVSRCAVCHRPTDEKLMGPGLKGVTQRREPQWIMNMIVNAEEMSQKDPVARELRKTHSLAMPNQDLTDEETRQVLEYLRKNDSQ